MVLRTMIQSLSMIDDGIERISISPVNSKRKDAIMITGRFEVLETGRPHDKAKKWTENPANKRTNHSGRHIALILNFESANWLHLQSTGEKRIQLTHDEEIGEYLHCSSRRRQPDPIIGRLSQHRAHKSSIGREGNACKALRETQCSRLKPERRSRPSKWREVVLPSNLD